MKIPKNSIHKKQIEAHIGKKMLGVMIIFTLILCVSLVSAFDWQTYTVAYWDFNNESGTTLEDIKGDAYDGTLKNMSNDDWTIGGILGNCLNFDRTGDEYISDIGRIVALESSNYTMNFWVMGNILDDVMWYSYDDDKVVNSNDLYMYQTDGFDTLIYPGGGGAMETPSANLGWLDGNWKMMTFVQNASHFYIYVNGSYYTQIADTGKSACANCVFKIGGGGGDYTPRVSWNGSFDEWAIFNKSLTQEEITELYNEGLGLGFESFGNKIEVDLSEPLDGTSITVVDTPTVFIINHSSVGFTLKNTTYHIWYSNYTIYNQSSYLLNSSNISKQGFTIGFGNFVWNALTCGTNTTSTLCNWATSNYTFDAGAGIDAISFPNNVSETERAIFTLNISLIDEANLFAARLNYNGTRYLGTKTLIDTTGYELTRIIDIPLIDSLVALNVSFHWEFEYKDGVQGNQNSSSYSHRVNPLIFQECNTTHPTNIVWNITVANESTRNFISSTLDGAFDFWLGTGTVTKGYSLDTATGTTKGNYTFCANRENVNVSATIHLKADDFYERTFYFNKENFNSSRTNTTLYLLDTGSSIIVEVTDPGLVAVVGHYINVYRYYPEIDEYLIIEKAQTDEFGQIVARLIEPDTVKYQFEFLDPDNNILKRTDDITIACRTTICVIPFVIEGTAGDFERFVNVTDFDYTLSFDNDTNVVTYTWNDVTGNSISSRLLVQRIAFNGTTTVCNSTSTSSANTLTCSLGSSKAKYRAQVFRTVSGGNERRIMVLNIEVGSTAAIFGLEGLFWAFILLFTLIGVGSFNPSVGIGLYTVGFVTLGVLGVISVPIPIFFANLVLGVIFIYAIRT